MKVEVDSIMREEQVVFRGKRVCSDQIAALMVIIEQAQERNSEIVVTFIDFKKTFDSQDRVILWKIMKS